MATNVRRSTGTSGRTSYGRSTSNTRNSGWSGTCNTNKVCGKSGTSKGIPAGYKNCHTNFSCKVNSYKTLVNQTQGTAKCARPSQAILNSFANWVNKGAIIHTVSTTQVARWAKTTNTSFNTRTPNPNSCKSVLWKKFGKSTIKAVARTKTGGFMIAAAPVVKGRAFCFPK